MKGLVTAVKLIATEGLMEPEWRKRKIKDQIDRDAKKNKWNLHTYRMLDTEWQWRIGMARLQLGIFDWEGWHLRNPRNGLIPTYYPIGFDGKLIILGEQGIGDEVMYAGLFHKYQEAHIECDPRLESIFRRSFPNTVYGRIDMMDKSWDDGSFDHQCFMADLAKKYWTGPDKFPKQPYLIPDPEKVAYWKQKLPENPIAISWKARQGNIDPDKLNLGGNYVSLQYGVEDHPDWCFVPDIDLKNDIEDVFAILANVQKVVSVPTSIAHFASAIGIPSEIIMTMYEGEIFNALNWRWGMGETTPFVPTARIYRNYDDYLRSIQKAERTGT